MSERQGKHKYTMKTTSCSTQGSVSIRLVSLTVICFEREALCCPGWSRLAFPPSTNLLSEPVLNHQLGTFLWAPFKLQYKVQVSHLMICIAVPIR
jgi:hypothetical protein